MGEYAKKKYLPEGSRIATPENREALASEGNLERAMQNGRILEGLAVLCDRDMTLHVDLGCMKGIIPRNEAVWSPEGNLPKDIAILTRVGKAVCFRIMGFTVGEDGKPCAVLSRRAAQWECVDRYLCDLIPGDIIDARVTHMEQFGAFVDVGCGVISLLSVDCISVSRISHPHDRFALGDSIRVVVRSCDPVSGKLYVSHKELLGTWEENAALFAIGQTVAGTVRSVEDYGIFVELTPNLAGLAEYRDGVAVGQNAAVYIKNIIPERMKIKLVLVDVGQTKTTLSRMRYYIPPDCLHIDRWQYSPQFCSRNVESVFNCEIATLP